MADYAPPSGPPPPKVPEGWKAVWNAQYSEWFFVNTYTRQSQWDKPTEPAHPPGEAPPAGAPPGYAPSSTHAPPTDSKAGLGSNNPYGGQPNLSEDEKLARKLQEEEEARVKAGGSSDTRGAANDFYNSGPQPNQYATGTGGYSQQGASSPYPQQQTQSPYQDPSSLDKGKSKGGLLGKLLGKAGGSSSHHAPSPYAQQQGYGAPQAGYYGAPQQGYYQQQQGGMYGRPPKKGGMGAGGAAALGLGGGLLGGALIGEAIGDAGDGGGDYGGDGGGDYGGGDGGGDFGGGDGGGDFGGGDF